jgi:maltose alpha-D-glucosyltransferase/alpha-amylase
MAVRRDDIPLVGDATWYKDAVIYECHVRAFRDSNGDGIGDFRGLTSKLDYLHDLGVTAIWLLPFYPSPLRDDGYDIADYRRVHPAYGTLSDFRTLLREAHGRGLRVITELVLAHTSDAHPWFQRARRARPGSSARDFYTWSDTADRYRDARVIFSDFETSNWAFDSIADAYYWHRFYSHQPSLNYDNPEVCAAMLDVVDFWLDLGVDGLRLDAVPYLYAREGTTCENLPETFAFLRELRAHVDRKFADRLLLAEANQWPEDAVAYLGAGDSCHMAFHFPLMPRMFMAARQEDRFPIVDILTETPPIPENCQWALFLRNHDELTLEMVTDEERDYMYRVYAEDPQARVNVGIRRRLAPLLGNDRKLIEMMNGLLLSLPGTPILYYGDEIGMGDNIYLGDRNAVRTPMQWDADRNAGFSTANPQRLFLPVIIDPEYHAQTVNVAAQQANSSSLLWWMKRMISLRTRHEAFARGTFELLYPDNRKVLAFIRRCGDAVVLVAVNLSRYTQAVELDLSEFVGKVPVELFGGSEFPPIGDLPYFLALGPHGIYWFSLEQRETRSEMPRPVIVTSADWSGALTGASRKVVEDLLPGFIVSRRWYRDKARHIGAVEILDAIVVPAERGDAPVALLLFCRVTFDHGAPQLYSVPLTFIAGPRALEVGRYHEEAVVAELIAGGQSGLLVEATIEPDFARALLRALLRRRQLASARGRLVGLPTPGLRRLLADRDDEPTVTSVGGEQSNTSLLIGGRVVMKLLRLVEEGIHPDVEMTRYLSERAHFANAPELGGHLEYRQDRNGAPTTVAIFEGFVPNEADGWNYVLDALEHGLEDVIAGPPAIEPRPHAQHSLLESASEHGSEDDILVGPHLGWAMLLGQRTAQLHLALATETDDPAFFPEPLSAIDRQAMQHAARSLWRQSLRAVRSNRLHSERVDELLGREDELLTRLSVIRIPVRVNKIRVHGDYHLGQVLWTGKDFSIIDFEGEPARSLATRRLKRPALVDVAGMIRSFDYASRAAAARVRRDLSTVEEAALEPHLTNWYRRVAGAYLHAYLEASQGASYLPATKEELGALLDFLLLEKAIYELGYEANSRPEWVDIPARGILELLGRPS